MSLELKLLEQDLSRWSLPAQGYYWHSDLSPLNGSLLGTWREYCLGDDRCCILSHPFSITAGWLHSVGAGCTDEQLRDVQMSDNERWRCQQQGQAGKVSCVCHLGNCMPTGRGAECGK